MDKPKPPLIPPRRSIRSNFIVNPNRFGFAESTPNPTQRRDNVGDEEQGLAGSYLEPSPFHGTSPINAYDEEVQQNVSSASHGSVIDKEFRTLRQQARQELEAAKLTRRNVEAQMSEALVNFKIRLADDKKMFDYNQQQEAKRIAKELAQRHRLLFIEMEEDKREHEAYMKNERDKLDEDIRLTNQMMEKNLEFLEKDLQLTRYSGEAGEDLYKFKIGNERKKKELDADDKLSRASSKASSQYDKLSFIPNPNSDCFVPATSTHPKPKQIVHDISTFEASTTNPFSPNFIAPPTPIASDSLLNQTLSTMANTINMLADARLQPIAAATNPSPSDPNRIDAFMARQSINKDLPRFSGSPIEWPLFIAQYRQTNESCRFSPEENMDRLGRCLNGKARDSVLALLSSPGNADAIITVLERRFVRPSFIIETLIEKARQVPVQKEDKLELFIDFANVVSNLAMTMESLECEGHLQNPQLLKELVSKLPASMKLRWGENIRSHGNTPILLTEFSSWLNDVADGASYVASFSAIPETKYNDNQRQKGFKTKNTVLATKGDSGVVADNTQAAGVKHESKPKDNSTAKPKVCCFCKKTDHVVSSCALYLKETVNDRWTWVKAQGICYGCLRKGHVSRECKSKKTCGKDDCKKLHHASLHFVAKIEDNSEGKKDDDKNEEWNLHASSSLSVNNRHSVLLKILPVCLKGPCGVIKTFALLDEGSTVTMLDANVAKRLGLKGKKTGFRWRGIGNSVQFDSASETVMLQISSVEQKTFYNLGGVQTITGMSLPAQCVSYKSLGVWKDNGNINLEELRGAKPMILIGQDHGDLIVSREVLDGPSNLPVLSRTKLGWVIHGAIGSSTGRLDNSYSFHISNMKEEDSLHRLVKEFFSTDTFGVKITAEGSRSREDRLAEVVLKKSTRRVANRFETGLLWRNDNISLPESRIQALHRLNAIEKKMDRNPEFSKLYEAKIEDYLSKEFIRKLSKKEIECVSPKTWYLPHFGVWNHNKPEKFRLVFDAASKSHGICLNDALLTGPDYLQPLPAVLYRFRRQQIGFIGDIEEMFHMVKVISDDQQAQRFLWRGTDRKRDPDVYVMQVMTFGAACSPTSAQYVKNLNAEEFQSEYPEASNAIIKGHYVDDYPDSADTVKEATKKIQDVIEVHRRGGFVIRNWICSSPKVLESIPVELRSSGVKDLSPQMQMPVERVLGLRWDPNADCFLFMLNFHRVDPKVLDGSRRPTKREVLTLVMSIFDPLGFLACFVIKGKLILQYIWRSGVGWDDKITDKVLAKWKIWIEELKSIVTFRIPRCYFFNCSQQETQLHIFCDASEKAFASVAYFRIEFEDRILTSFVTAKTRVAPLKPMSVPRLELQGALMGSRISESILKAHDVPIKEVHFWTDSKTVLGWIRSNARRFKTFVSHRVGEISELTDVNQWHYVPTGLNVADEATRDHKPSEFDPNSRWICGPSFLRLQKEDWPQEEAIINSDLEFTEEIKKEFVAILQQSACHLPNISNYSSWLRLLRVTAWVRRFGKRFFVRFKNKTLPNSPNYLEPDEIDAAEKSWIRQIQLESFPTEVKRLLEKTEISAKSRLAPLSACLDSEGIIRLKGRLDKADGFDYWIKQPVILDPDHYYTRLLLDHYHKKAGHHGQETVFNEVRQKYWVINLRQAVRSTWSRCFECKFRRSQPLVPEMESLPACRLTPYVRPFTFTGVDYFGPMLVTVKRSKVKRYGVLFTCLTSRAVHLEIADYLTTDSAIMAIRQFLARRGQPKQMWSDNGTNFKGSDRELRESLLEFDQKRICNALSPKKIEWHFIPPASPHMGGCWERFVQSVKKALKSILHEHAPQQEVLATVFAEAEHMVNCRPLTHVSVDPNDPESLTPNHLLLSSSNGAALDTPGIFHDADLCLRRQWRISQRLADHFWKRWIHEYLPTLTRRTKWHRPTTPIKKDDLVIIVDENLPRNTWLRGIVVAVYPGKDGQVRVVEVKTSQGIYRRPAAKICVLDVKEGLGKEDGRLLPLGGMLSSPQEEKK